MSGNCFRRLTGRMPVVDGIATISVCRRSLLSLLCPCLLLHHVATIVHVSTITIIPCHYAVCWYSQTALVCADQPADLR